MSPRRRATAALAAALLPAAIAWCPLVPSARRLAPLLPARTTPGTSLLAVSGDAAPPDPSPSDAFFWDDPFTDVPVVSPRDSSAVSALVSLSAVSNTEALNALLKEIAGGRTPAAASRAEDVLLLAERLLDGPVPDGASYTIVLCGWGRSTHSLCGECAEGLLRHMEAGGAAADGDGGAAAAGRAEMPRRRVAPNTIHYSAVMNAWAKSRTDGSAGRAEAILDALERAHDSRPDRPAELRPNKISYGTVIKAWATSRGGGGAAERASRVLQRMEERAGDDPSARPDAVDYGIVINAWARCRERGSAQRAQNILDRMERVEESARPGAAAFGAVIDAWARSGEPRAAERAELALDGMERAYAAGRQEARPHRGIYAGVIAAHAASGDPRAPERALGVLRRMDRAAVEGNWDAAPDGAAFNAVIAACARGGVRGCAKRAEGVLAFMTEAYAAGNYGARPSVVSFNNVIVAWSKTREEGSAERAEWVLRRMVAWGLEDGCGRGQTPRPPVMPNTVSFNAVINAWAKSGRPVGATRAEEVLSLMERLYIEGDDHVKPSSLTFNSVLNAWAKSGAPGAARRAEEILLKMEALADAGICGVRPDTISFNTVIDACRPVPGTSRGDDSHILDIARRTFEKIVDLSNREKFGRPDSVTYSTFLNACFFLSSGKEQEAMVRKVFKRCCDDGLLDDFILRQLRRQLRLEMFREMFGKYKMIGVEGLSVKKLPPKWSRNVELKRVRKNPKQR